jgi:hypothetical protein
MYLIGAFKILCNTSSSKFLHKTQIKLKLCTNLFGFVFNSLSFDQILLMPLWWMMIYFSWLYNYWSSKFTSSVWRCVLFCFVFQLNNFHFISSQVKCFSHCSCLVLRWPVFGPKNKQNRKLKKKLKILKTRKLYLWICNNLSLFFKIHLKCLRKILTFTNKLWNHIQTFMNFLHMSWNLLKVTYFSFSNFSVLISLKTEFFSEWESEPSSWGKALRIVTNSKKMKKERIG